MTSAAASRQSPVGALQRRIVRMLRITLAGLHLIALGLGLGAVLARGTALRESASNAACDGEINFTGCDRPCGSSHGIHPRRTETIDGRAGDGIGKARQQKRHTSYVAIVFAGLIGAAKKNLIEARPIDFRIALQ